MSWHRISSLDDVPGTGGRTKVVIDGRELALLHTPEGLYCIDYRCPHTGGPLGDGPVEDGSITCPLHRWKFDLADGCHSHPKQAPPAGVHQLKLEDNELMVELT